MTWVARQFFFFGKIGFPPFCPPQWCWLAVCAKSPARPRNTGMMFCMTPVAQRPQTCNKAAHLQSLCYVPRVRKANCQLDLDLCRCQVADHRRYRNPCGYFPKRTTAPLARHHAEKLPLEDTHLGHKHYTRFKDPEPHCAEIQSTSNLEQSHLQFHCT